MCDKKRVYSILGKLTLELVMQSIKDHKNMFGNISENEVDMILARGHHFPRRCWYVIKNLLIDIKFLTSIGKQNRGREFKVRGQTNTS